MSPDQAPFIPPAQEEPTPPPPWRVFESRGFRRLWCAQVTSSLGDWIGIIAILSIAARVSKGSGAAVSLVMVARLAPGFILAPVGGVLIDRWDRRKVMVACDLGRAAMLAVLPFVDSLYGLVIVSLLLEAQTLLWGPAKDASVPKLVTKDQLTSANSLGMVAAYGTFPLGGLIFASLAAVSAGLGGVSALHGLQINQEFLALWVDGLTYLASALFILGLPLGRNGSTTTKPKSIDWSQTWRELLEGLRFIKSRRVVRGVMIGMGAGLIGGGALVPLGPVFAEKVLRGGPATFSLLMVALGTGAAVGVITVLWVQRWIPKEIVFSATVTWSGISIITAASFSSLAPAAFAVAMVGAFAGCAYVTGFSILQSDVSDELRGRTFATLYTVVRVCVLLSLTVSPLFSDFFQWISGQLFNHRTIEIGSLSYALPGVRLALWMGGLVALFAGLVANRQIHKGNQKVETT